MGLFFSHLAHRDFHRVGLLLLPCHAVLKCPPALQHFAQPFLGPQVCLPISPATPSGSALHPYPGRKFLTCVFQLPFAQSMWLPAEHVHLVSERLQSPASSTGSSGAYVAGENRQTCSNTKAFLLGRYPDIKYPGICFKIIRPQVLSI